MQIETVESLASSSNLLTIRVTIVGDGEPFSRQVNVHMKLPTLSFGISGFIDYAEAVEKLLAALSLIGCPLAAPEVLKLGDGMREVPIENPGELPEAPDAASPILYNRHGEQVDVLDLSSEHLFTIVRVADNQLFRGSFFEFAPNTQGGDIKRALEKADAHALASCLFVGGSYIVSEYKGKYCVEGAFLNAHKAEANDAAEALRRDVGIDEIVIRVVDLWEYRSRPPEKVAVDDNPSDENRSTKEKILRGEIVLSPAQKARAMQKFAEKERVESSGFSSVDLDNVGASVGLARTVGQSDDDFRRVLRTSLGGLLAIGLDEQAEPESPPKQAFLEQYKQVQAEKRALTNALRQEIAEHDKATALLRELRKGFFFGENDGRACYLRERSADELKSLIDEIDVLLASSPEEHNNGSDDAEAGEGEVSRSLRQNEPENDEQGAESARKIIVGDFVIVNDFDCPEDRLIAQVHTVNDDGSFGLRYRNIERPLMTGMTNPTLVEDFGRTIVISADGIATRTSGLDSVATYADGSPRNWQGGSK